MCMSVGRGGSRCRLGGATLVSDSHDHLSTQMLICFCYGSGSGVGMMKEVRRYIPVFRVLEVSGGNKEQRTNLRCVREVEEEWVVVMNLNLVLKVG